MPSGILIDFIIVLFLIVSVFRGINIGFVRQIFSAIGFFGGLFLGAFFEPDVIKLVHTPASRSILALVCTLGLAFIFLVIGEYLGIYLKKHIYFKKLNIIDSILGLIISLLTTVFSIWLAAAILSSTSIPGIALFINSSSIIRYLNRTFPSAPVVISDLGSIIDPNGFPRVFVGNEPIPVTTSKTPSLASLQTAINADVNSVVKIEGLGCGGLVEGSGFIVGPGLVATNAHVVAGIRQIYVISDNKTLHAVALYFNPNLDFAVLKVNGLSGTPLKINPKILSNGTDEAVIGYPGGGPLSVKPALILNEINAVGLNIYGQGNTDRSVYELKADIIPGNSGGPLIAKSGYVTGVVFAQSTTYNQVGYALTANQIINPINQAKHSTSSVQTGGCAE